MSGHVLDRLSEYLDAALEPEEQVEVREHLAGCSECRSALEEIRGVDALARMLAIPSIEAGPGDLATRVRAVLVGEAVQGRRLAPQWLAAAAVLAVALVVPWLVFRGSPTAETPASALVLREPDAPPAPTAARPAAGEKRQSAPSLAREDAVRAKARAEPEEAAVPHVLPAAPPPPAKTRDSERKAAGEVDAANRSAPGATAAQATAAVGFSASRKEAVAGNGPDADAAEAFRALAAKRSRSGDEARRLREEWVSFVRRFPEDPRAAQARFAVLEASAAAYRLDRREDDLERLRTDVAEYERTVDPEHAAAAQRLLEDVTSGRSP